MSSLVFPVGVSIVFYLVMLGGGSLLVYLSHVRQKPYLAWIAVVLLILMVALRGIETGSDTVTYGRFMDDIVRRDVSDAWSRVVKLFIEPFIVGLALLGKVVSAPVQLLVFLPHSIITVVFFYLSSRRASMKNGWLIFTLLMFTVLLSSLNIMRQMASAAVLLHAFTYLPNRMDRETIAKISLLVLLAVGIHFSAVIIALAMMAAYYLSRVPNIEWSRFKLPYVLLSCVIFSVPLFYMIIQSEAVVGLLPIKIGETMARYGVGLHYNYNFLLYLATFIYLVISRERSRYLKSANVYIAIMFVALTISVPAFFSAYLGRITDYFFPFAIVSVVVVTEPWLNKDRRLVKCAVILAATYCIMKFFIMGDSGVLPYSFFVGGSA